MALATPSELLAVWATTQQSLLDMVDMGDMGASRLSLAASLAVELASRPSLAEYLVVDALQVVVPQEQALATPAWVSRPSPAASLAVKVASRLSLAASLALAVASRRSLAEYLVVDALQEVVPQERALATPAWVCTPDLPTLHPCLPMGGVATTMDGEREVVASTLALTLGGTPFPLTSPAEGVVSTLALTLGTTPFLLASPALDQLLCTGQVGVGVPLEGVDHLGLLEGAGHLDQHMGRWLEA